MSTQAELLEIEPRTGDVSVCFYCMTIGVFDDELLIVEPTLEQLERFAEDEDLQKSIKRLRVLKAKYS